MPAQVDLIKQHAVINQLASAASPPTFAKSARMVEMLRTESLRVGAPGSSTIRDSSYPRIRVLRDASS